MFGNINMAAAILRSVFSSFELDVLELPVEQNQQVDAWQKRPHCRALAARATHLVKWDHSRLIVPLPGCAHVF